MRQSILREHSVFVDNVLRMIEVEITPLVNKWEQAGHFPNSLFEILGNNGFLGLLIDESLGGVGGDYNLAAAWCDTFGEIPSHGMVTGINMHSLVILPSLARHGTSAMKEKWIPDGLKGTAIGAYAFTEPDAGSDLARIKSTATKTDNGWLLNGSKIFITNGARAHFVLVLAKTDPTLGYKGFSTFVVDTSLIGFTVPRTLSKLGWHASDTAELVLDNVEVSNDCLLGNRGEGWTQASNNLSWERLMLTLTSLAGGRACLTRTERYARDRVAFGSPIADLPGIKHFLDDMWGKYYLGESLTYSVLTDLIEGKEGFRGKAAAAKRMVCEDMVWLADKAIQIHGGYGYTTEFSAERWWRDLRLMTLGGGTSEIMGNLVEKELVGK